MTQQTQKITALLNEIKVISSELPKGKSHMVHNRCSKIQTIIKKPHLWKENEQEIPNDMERPSAKKAILNALLEGRHLSQMDCAEFMIEDMRTVVSHLKEHYEDTHILNTKWIRTPVRNSRVKEYWLTAKA